VLLCANELMELTEQPNIDAGDIRWLDVAQLNHKLRRLNLGPPGEFGAGRSSLRSSHPH